MSRDLLKEAIADAKAVKETAIANAKAYLEEAFTPQLRSMLAAKLEEMDEDEVSETVSEEEISEKEYKQYRTAKEKAEGDQRKEDDQAEEDTELMAKGEIAEEEELDLDEILKSLEEEDTNVSEDARTDAEEEGYLDGMKDEKEDEEHDHHDEEEEELDLEDMTEDDLKSFIETVIVDMVAAGELEAGEEMVADEDEEIEGGEEFEVEDEVEVEVSEDARTDAEEEGYEDGFKDAKKDVRNALDKMKVAEAERTTELNEAYDTIKTLKSELNEINLLNAKLLYTNKIFRNKTLTENQKVKVLNAFDKAGTVKEVKIVFETLNENLKVKTKEIKENLGFASKATGKVITESKKPVVETDPMVERFKKLAGIK